MFKITECCPILYLLREYLPAKIEKHLFHFSRKFVFLSFHVCFVNRSNRFIDVHRFGHQNEEVPNSSSREPIVPRSRRSKSLWQTRWRDCVTGKSLHGSLVNYAVSADRPNCRDSVVPFLANADESRSSRVSNSRRSRGCRRRTRNFLFHHPSPFRKPRGSIPRDKSAITIFDYRLYANSREVILCVVHHRIESNNKISHSYHPLSCLFLSFLLLLPLLFFSFFFFSLLLMCSKERTRAASRAQHFSDRTFAETIERTSKLEKWTSGGNLRRRWGRRSRGHKSNCGVAPLVSLGCKSRGKLPWNRAWIDDDGYRLLVRERVQNVATYTFL